MESVWLTFGIANDCMPQARYAEQTKSFKYLVVHGHVHQTWAMVLVVLKGKQYKCGADGGGGGGKKSNRSEIVQLRRKGGGNYV